MIWLKILLLLIAIDISLADACYKCTDSSLETGTGQTLSKTAEVYKVSVDGATTLSPRVKRAAATTTTPAPVKTTKVKTTKAPRTTTTEPPPPIKWSPILGICIPFAIILIIVVALHVFRIIRK
ncbi:hypothetical protein PRIPAC_79446 [Pristionchus pacificus]|uniref:Uncharacterized protein n=1 Tax=Pristionchus pacificus TaxID=54126 RepID=A0A2A6C498_PRIPA|nr:hypothetical protein PRIPAC_79446 [Pristionchus pacificus]|eukprot:PDM72984.1 hypothetical protein PRIPAC_39418 [Pristionchus pacificus]